VLLLGQQLQLDVGVEHGLLLLLVTEQHDTGHQRGRVERHGGRTCQRRRAAKETRFWRQVFGAVNVHQQCVLVKVVRQCEAHRRLL